MNLFIEVEAEPKVNYKGHDCMNFLLSGTKGKYG